MKSRPLEVTDLLDGFRRGDKDAESQLFEALYEELREIARRRFRKESAGHTLQPTALIAEAYPRLLARKGIQWQSRGHFLAVASVAMRRILIDHARRKRSGKRGGNEGRVDLLTSHAITESDYDTLLIIDQALKKLEMLDARQMQIVEMIFFGGLTQEEVADLFQLSVKTVKREWALARAWLNTEIRSERLNPD